MAAAEEVALLESKFAVEHVSIQREAVSKLVHRLIHTASSPLQTDVYFQLLLRGLTNKFVPVSESSIVGVDGITFAHLTIRHAHFLTDITLHAFMHLPIQLVELVKKNKYDVKDALHDLLNVVTALTPTALSVCVRAVGELLCMQIEKLKTPEGT